MRINVGSQNSIKIDGVIKTFAQFSGKFPKAEVGPVKVEVEEFGHPKNIEQIMQGAIDRARQSYTDSDLGVGLESGLIEVPGSRTGYLEIGAAVIYDGKEIYSGLSSAFEWPKDVTKYILEGKGDGSQAFKALGYTTSTKQGAEKGGVSGQLTEGRITREDTIVESLTMALIALLNPDYK